MGHREDLLAGARRCLEDRGYARTTARDLVAVSGTNLASIGYHFGSKEALLNEAIAASFQEWAQRIHELAFESAPKPTPKPTPESAPEPAPEPIPEPALEVDGAGDGGTTADPSALLAACYEAMLTSFVEYRGLGVAFIEALAQAERQPELRRQLARAYADGRTRIAATITDMVGDLPAERARAFAAFQIAVCDGLLVQWLLDPDATPPGAEMAAALYQIVTLSSR